MPQEGEVRQNRLDLNRKAIFTAGQWYEIGAPGKPMAGAAMSADSADAEAINTGSSINANLSKYESQLSDGSLRLGPIANPISSVKNALGMSDEHSQNYASFRAGLEKMRNDSLRLNKGTQTEGDATRAWNELLANTNDPGVVQKRLREIDAYNQQAIQFRKRSLSTRRATQGAMMIDPGQFEVPRNAFVRPPAKTAPQGRVKPSGTKAGGLTDAQIKAALGL